MYKHGTFGYLALHSGVVSGMAADDIKNDLIMVKMKSDERKTSNSNKVVLGSLH